MPARYLSREAEADAGSRHLCRGEGSENGMGLVGGDAGAIVADIDQDRAVLGAQRQGDMAGGARRLDRVLKKRPDRLVKLVPVQRTAQARRCRDGQYRIRPAAGEESPEIVNHLRQRDLLSQRRG